jgi:hypothetical protein
LEFYPPFFFFFRNCKCKTLLPLNYQIHTIMKALQRNFYFFTTVLVLSSCASFENLTDDRTRAEDDEMYWNGKELFYDNALLANAGGSGDDYYDPNSSTRSNSFNGGTNPRATFNPISGWQLSYGLNAFSNYNNGFGMGFGSFDPMFNNWGFGNNGFNSFGYNPYGFNSFGYNPYGFNSFGFNPYSSYNPYWGYAHNPYGYGMGGFGWGGNGFGNGWNGNGWNNPGGGWWGSVGNGETPNVTHHHRRPTSVGTGNSSTYNRGVLQKNLVQPIAETPRAPKPVTSVVTNGNYSLPSNTRGGTPQYTSPGSSPARSTTSPSRTTPNYSSPTYASPSRSNPSNTRPSQSTPSPSTPSRSTSPSRTTPAPSSPSHSAPTRTSTPSRSTSPSPSSPSRSTSPSKRP